MRTAFRRLVGLVMVMTAAVAGCASEDGAGPVTSHGQRPAPTTVAPSIDMSPTTATSAATSPAPWIEEEVLFSFGDEELFGVVTLPSSGGPFPAVVLVSGSASLTSRQRSGTTDRYYVDHARMMARVGFAALRYDPPGVGRSTGRAGFEGLDTRAEETLAAVRHLQMRVDISADRIGLWGGSQGAWVIEIAAAEHPDDIAFLISVSGSGVSVADQQVYSIEAQSAAAGMDPIDVTRASLLGRLLIDWQLPEPMYRERNEVDAAALGEGPWNEFSALVYEPGNLSPASALDAGIVVLASVQSEPWARFLYLEELYLPQLRSIPADQVEAVSEAAGMSLLLDPEDYLTAVRCPVLAIFGEADVLQPTATSVARYRTYLAEAGNTDVAILVLPGVGHEIGLATPGYREALSSWLEERRAA